MELCAQLPELESFEPASLNLLLTWSLRKTTAAITATRPGIWAFHCHILPHVEGTDGMFGMVATLIVVPTKEDVDAIICLTPLPAGLGLAEAKGLRFVVQTEGTMPGRSAA